MPAVGAPPEVGFPAFQRATLANGLKIILAERHSIPLVRLSLLVDAGYAADQFAVPGTASLAMSMLDEGTSTGTSLQINDELALLGAELGVGSNLDTSFVTLSALKDRLDASLDIFADVILHPSFPEGDFQRLQKLQIAEIQQEKDSPEGMALRVFPKLVFSSDHAYGNPLSGSGYETSVAKLTRNDMVRFHQTWFKPNHATLVVVGDTNLSELKPKLEKFFRGWEGGQVPAKNISSVPLKKSAVFILDKPDAPQSFVMAGHAAPSSADPDDIAIETMNTILGGEFVSRINMNLREDKHWSYGANSFLAGARGQRPFIILAPVQADKTKEAIAEIEQELEGILGQKPVTREEFENAKSTEVLQLPGQWETMASVESSLEKIVQYGLPDDHYQKFPTRVRQLTLDDVAKAAKKTVHPENVQWVVVGDRAKVEPKIRELGFAEIHVIDADGNIIR
jgi:zinc protease